MTIDNKSHFRWRGKLWLKGLFDREHYFRLEALESNKTLFIHGERFSGLLVAPLMKMIGENTKRGFEQMNEALKMKVEGVGRS